MGEDSEALRDELLKVMWLVTTGFRAELVASSQFTIFSSLAHPISDHKRCSALEI